MKTTLLIRTIANPRRTTLAHLTDAEEQQAPQSPEWEHTTELPARTANPRRTVLDTVPQSTAPGAEAAPGTPDTAQPDTAQQAGAAQEAAAAL